MRITRRQLNKIIKESLGLRENFVKKAISKIPYKTLNKIYDRHQGVGTFLANIKVNEQIKQAKPEDWWVASEVDSAQTDTEKGSKENARAIGMSKRLDGYGYMMYRKSDGEYKDKKTGKKVVINYDWACCKSDPKDKNYTWVRHQTYVISDDKGTGYKVTINKTNSDDAPRKEEFIVNGKRMKSLRDVYENLKASGVDIQEMLFAAAEALDVDTYEID
jgi:hypothetical protein